MAMPKLTLTTGTAPVEGGAIGTYLIKLDQAAPVGGLTVNFNTLGSTATMNTDYHFTLGAEITAVTSNSFTIAEGASTAVLNLVAHADADADAILDSNETVILNLTTGTDYQLAGASTSSFAPKVDYATGINPRSVTTGDFNGDGKLDMAVANFNANTVSVLLGTGSGTFAAKVDYATGTNSISVTTGDFNGDGKLDMATANWSASTVSVLLGTGNGTFAPKVDVATRGNPFSMTTGDFNGDGKLDMAVANLNANNPVSVLLGTGNGTFAPKVDYVTGADPYSVTTGDLNGDGKLDMAVANWSASTVSVLLGTGSGTFAAKVDYATGTNPYSVTTGDFNGDGNLDMAAANANADTVSVLLGTGNGTFAPKVDYATGAYPNSVITGDFNGDGKLDMAVANANADTVSVLFGTGSGTFAAKVDYATGDFPISVTTGDFNGDGKLDMAVADFNANTVSVLLNNATPSATLTIADSSQNNGVKVSGGSTRTPTIIEAPAPHDIYFPINFPYRIQNHAPILTTPATIHYTDTAFVDNFATVTGRLLASDVDSGTALTYGIVGGTGTDVITMNNAYGQLTVTKTTGAYSFVPDSAAMEALSADVTSTFTVTVSDGQLTNSKTLVIDISQSGITESRGNDRLTGTSGDDVFNGLAGNDTISSLAGNDIINGGAGADTMMGGKGDDEYYVDNLGDVVKERDCEGEDAVYTTVSYGLSTNVENIVLMGTVAIIGTGNKLNNHLTGNGAGSTLDGLGGDDNYYVSRAGDIIAESAGNGWDTVISSINYTLENNIEELYLTGTGHLNGTGNARYNNLHGNKGDNILDGGKGDDYLQGMNGADTLIGGLGKDNYDLAETMAATDTVRIAKGDSLVSSYDVATGFKLGTNSVDTAGVDKLDLDSTDIAADAVAVNGSNSGNIKSHHISAGIISFDDSNYYTNPLTITDANLANVFSYLQANIKAQNTVAFVSEGNTFVFQDGGAIDTLVELVGVTTHSVNTTGLGMDALWLA